MEAFNNFDFHRPPILETEVKERALLMRFLRPLYDFRGSKTGYYAGQVHPKTYKLGP